MWRCSVLALFALATGACGSGHESVQSEATHAAASQPERNEAPAVADAVSAVDGEKPFASVLGVDAAAAEPSPANDATTAKPRAASGSGQRATADMRCTLRVSAKGIFVDGDPKSREEAIAACKRTAGAVVVLEEGAPAGEWKTLQAALRRAGVPILMRGVVGDGVNVNCMNNPLAQGCK